MVDTVAPIQVSSAEISPIYDHDRLADALQDLTLTSNIKMSIGSTTVGGTYLIECTEDDATEPLDDECQVMMNLEENDDAIESFMSSAAHARQRRNITPEYLSKVWRIDIPTAKQTLAVTSQRSVRPNDSKLARNYSTNDQMVRYKRIDEYFFMDTFMATGKAHRSTRGNTCCQLFVSDKGFLYVVPMRLRSMVPQALRQFTKEIGTPEAIICDHSGE